jgi:hypothetical protein
MPRTMKQIYYLLWNSDAWGVYDKSACPDPGAFPNFWYKKYQIKREKSSELFKKLMKIKERLVKEDITPSKENYNKIFPELEELLK